MYVLYTPTKCNTCSCLYEEVEEGPIDTLCTMATTESNREMNPLSSLYSFKNSFIGKSKEDNVLTIVAAVGRPNWRKLIQRIVWVYCGCSTHDEGWALPSLASTWASKALREAALLAEQNGTPARKFCCSCAGEERIWELSHRCPSSE